MALIFLVVVSLIVISMATWTSTGLNNSIRFTAAQSTVSAANSATELAVQYERYNFLHSTLNVSPPVSCWPGTGGSATSYNGANISVWCSTLWSPSNTSQTRIVTFSTCLSTLTSTQCAATPLLQAVVYFDDYSATNHVCGYAPPLAGSTCGLSMAIHSWVFVPIPPVVTNNSVGAVGGPCPTSNQFTLFGTGFSSPAQVYFIVQASGNLVYQVDPSSIVVSSSTVLTGCEPTSGSGTATVVVATPTGTSAALTSPPSADQITY